MLYSNNINNIYQEFDGGRSNIIVQINMIIKAGVLHQLASILHQLATTKGTLIRSEKGCEIVNY